jgi:hypothetical protein
MNSPLMSLISVDEWTTDVPSVSRIGETDAEKRNL